MSNMSRIINHHLAVMRPRDRAFALVNSRNSNDSALSKHSGISTVTSLSSESFVMYDVSEMDRNPFFTGEASFFSQGIRTDSSDKPLLLFEEANDTTEPDTLLDFQF